MCNGAGRLPAALKDAEKGARLELIGASFVREVLERKDAPAITWCLGKLREMAESARKRAALYEDTAKQLEG